MEVKLKFNDINVKEEKEKTLVKILMLKGEKGEKGDGDFNVIEDVKVNGTSLPVSNKSVNVEIPTNNSAFNNDSGYLVENDMQMTTASDIQNGSQITDGTGYARLNKIYGDTQQEGTPTPDTPIDIEVVTGDINIIISDSDNTSSQQFTIPLGEIELCKIKTYKDEIYKDNGKWYKKANIGKVKFSDLVYGGIGGSFSNFSTNGNIAFYYQQNDLKVTGNRNDTLCNLLTSKSTSVFNGVATGINNYSNDTKFLLSVPFSNVEQYAGVTLTSSNYINYGKNYISSLDGYIYYILNEPMITEITDFELIEQLDEIYNFILYINETNFTITGDDLIPTLNIIYSITDRDIYSKEEIDDLMLENLDLINKKIYYFDSVSTMKANTLNDGDMVITKGYYASNDGGSAKYKIRKITNDDVVDNQFIIALLDNTLVAELIIDDKLNVLQVGAKGDNSTDNSVILKNMFNVCRTKNITSIYFPHGTYRVSQTLLDYGIDGLHISGENDDLYNSTIIRRTADVTVFNFGSTMELTGRTNKSDDLILENLTFRDLLDTYTENVFATIHYTQHFTIQNCTISCKNKALDLKHCYDSRFINTDFSAGGNSNDAMIVLHGGKHASPSEIGWDSANCISFIGCRFERYYGCAIKTTTEEQPAQYNTTFDPCIAENVNTIFFSMCRFEAPTLLTGKHLDFNYTTNLRLDIQMTVLDGQNNLQPINFNRCLGVFGNISVSYNRHSDGTYESFEQPIMNILNNCSRFDLNLMVTNVYSTYSLDYFVNIEAGDLSRRTMNINLIYDGKSKKLYNMTSSNQILNIYKQGRNINYGKYENGYGMKVDNEVYNSYFNNMSYDATNERYSLDTKYVNSANTNRTLDTIVSDDIYSYHKYSYPILMDNALFINPSKYPTSQMTVLRSNGTISRAIMYASTYPTSEETNALFKVGDIIFNTLPTAGGNVGWVCTASGNPGTWKAFGQIES